jgi:hypothetical protein
MRRVRRDELQGGLLVEAGRRAIRLIPDVAPQRQQVAREVPRRRAPESPVHDGEERRALAAQAVVDEAAGLA